MLYAATSDDNTVIEFAWKDMQIVLFISTVADCKRLNYLNSIAILLASAKVLRERKHPATTATEAA
jgi:hypothetical protein